VASAASASLGATALNAGCCGRACAYELIAEAPLRVQDTLLSREGQVLRELARIIDPDFGMDIVSCGFVKELQTDAASGRYSGDPKWCLLLFCGRCVADKRCLHK
jgi:hypothetical protein